MTDAEFRMMSVVRKIDARTSDGDVDAAADKLEAAIRVRTGWVRELLFALRSIDSGEVFVEMFAASVGAGRQAGIIGEKMAGALERLAEQRKRFAGTPTPTTTLGARAYESTAHGPARTSDLWREPGR